MKNFIILLVTAALLIGFEVYAQESSAKLTSDYISAEHNLTVQDDMAIRQTIARLNHSIDLSDYKAYVSFFAKDAVFNTAFGQAKGPQQIEAALEASRPYITGKRHVASTVVINGDNKRAVATSYLIVFEATTSLDYLGSAVNIDTFEKQDDRWVIIDHTTVMDPATIKAMQAK
jgi:ketosteroid isomerase-like protein